MTNEGCVTEPVAMAFNPSRKTQKVVQSTYLGIILAKGPGAGIFICYNF